MDFVGFRTLYKRLDSFCDEGKCDLCKKKEKVAKEKCIVKDFIEYIKVKGE